MYPYEIVRIVYVLSSILTTEFQDPYNILLSEILDSSGNLNYKALRYVENCVAQNKRKDLEQLIQQTMRGNYSLLQNFENFLEYRRQFHGIDDNPGNGHPSMYYRYTTNNNPVCQESGGIQCGEDPPHEPVMPCPFEQFGHSPPEETRRSRETRIISPSAQPERDVQQSHGNHARTNARGLWSSDRRSKIVPQSIGARCHNCEKDFDIIRSSNIWRQIDDIMTRLSPQQVQMFMVEMVKYDHGMMKNAQFQSVDGIDDVISGIISKLKKCNLQGQKCIFCVLIYMLQRIGRRDLADEVKEIRQTWQG